MTEAESYRRIFKAMGSPCEIQLFAASQDAGCSHADAGIAEVERLEQPYSRYRDDSFLAQINRAALAGASVAVDDETALLLDYADTCFRESGGLFDISSGILRRAWDFKSGKVADQGELDALLPLVGWDKVRWHRPMLSFAVPGMELDLGGVVKEYAVDRVAALLAARGVDSGFVNLGGDLRVVGPRPGGEPWSVGIRHHRLRDGVAGVVKMERGALASSGDYERCILLDGVHYGHILNPTTGWPVRELAAVSVIADLCLVAGSAATIAMLKDGAGREWLTALALPFRWTDVAGNSGGDF
ncbi:MAG: FAD:protein FMN transferase [Sphingomicrobium sp.]